MAGSRAPWHDAYALNRAATDRARFQRLARRERRANSNTPNTNTLSTSDKGGSLICQSRALATTAVTRTKPTRAIIDAGGIGKNFPAANVTTAPESEDTPR